VKEGQRLAYGEVAFPITADDAGWHFVQTVRGSNRSRHRWPAARQASRIVAGASMVARSTRIWCSAVWSEQSILISGAGAEGQDSRSLAA